MKPYIIFVEDDEALSLLIKYNLEVAGFDVTALESDESLYETIEERKPSLIILDWMLPNNSGVEIAKEIRSFEYTSQIPIIMLTAKSLEEDKLTAFEVGCDDYLTKPFSPKELIARIKSVIKRTNPLLMQKDLSYGAYTVDTQKKNISVGNRILALSPTEYKLLSFMIAKPERVHSRDFLIDNIWGNEDNIESRVVDVTIRRIRAILAKIDPDLAQYIKTIRGEGYILDKE